MRQDLVPTIFFCLRLWIRAPHKGYDIPVVVERERALSLFYVCRSTRDGWLD
jgi:hypothetical protein